MTLKQRIGAQIKQARINHGLSQQDLANELGFSYYQRVLLWETGKTFPTLEAFEKLEKVLQLKLDLTSSVVSVERQ